MHVQFFVCLKTLGLAQGSSEECVFCTFVGVPLLYGQVCSTVHVGTPEYM